MPVLMEAKDSPAKRRRFVVPICPAAAATTVVASGTKKKSLLNTGAEDITVLEPQTIPTKRRRLSLPCCRSATVMTPFGSNKKRLEKRKQPMDDGEEKTLRLSVEPPATQMKRRRINRSKYLHLDVKEGNFVYGEVQGHRCDFLVDSGSTYNTMFLSHAHQLGLITGNEKKVSQKIIMWDGFRIVQIILLEEVVITLEGCMKVKISIQVLPKDMETLYNTFPKMIVLGIEFLKPGHMFQEFSSSGASRLYIRKPKQLEQRPSSNRKFTSIWFKVLRKGSKKPTHVLVDTGAAGFFTTKYLMRRTKVMPKHASLLLEAGSCLNTTLQIRPTNDRFCILGRNLLYKYDAVVDYGRSLVTFKVGDKDLRIFHCPE